MTAGSAAGAADVSFFTWCSEMSDKKRILFTIIAAVAVVAAATSVLAALVLATDVFLLSFLGVLFAVFLTKSSVWATRRSGLTYRWSLGLITLALLLATAGSLYLFGATIEQRVREASSHLDDGAEQLRDWVKNHPMVETAVTDLPFANRLLSPEGSRTQETESGSTQREDSPGNPSGESSRPASDDQTSEGSPQESRQSGNGSSLSGSPVGQAARVIAKIFQTTLGAVMNLAIVLFVGLFLAVDPELYRDGFVRLFPQPKRMRVKEILNETGDTLWSWLLGRFGSMAITGVGTGLGLAMLGVPMPILLGTITGLLTFIPNIGPAIGLALAVLVALPEGGSLALMVVGVFLGFQLLESYVITPLIQQSQVSIPPALLIAWQVLMGVLTGFLGVTVSTPLLAVAFVFIRMAYLEDVLKDQTAMTA